MYQQSYSTEVRKLSTFRGEKVEDGEKREGRREAGTGQTWGLVGHGKEFGLHPRALGSHWRVRVAHDQI